MVSARDLIQFVTGTRPLVGSGISKQQDKVRSAMLQVLRTNSGQVEPSFEQRILFAADMEALWYLRGDILQVIQPPGGELTARRQLEPIDRMFKGWLPGTMQPRAHSV